MQKPCEITARDFYTANEDCLVNLVRQWLQEHKAGMGNGSQVRANREEVLGSRANTFALTSGASGDSSLPVTHTLIALFLFGRQKTKLQSATVGYLALPPCLLFISYRVTGGDRQRQPFPWRGWFRRPRSPPDPAPTLGGLQRAPLGPLPRRPLRSR